MAGTGAAQAVPAAQVIVTIIPIVGIVMGAVVIFFYLFWRHRQVIEQIKAGVYKKPSFDLYAFSLLSGFLLAGTGLMLSLLFLAVGGIGYPLLGGLIPFGLGSSLIGFYFIAKPGKNKIERES